MSYQERAKNIFLKHGTGAGDLASVIMKSEDQVDLLAKQCVKMVYEIGQMRAELARVKSIDVSLIPGKQWTLERFNSICEIKMPEAAMVGGEQLLALLQCAEALGKEERRRLGAEACLKSWKEDEGADAARFAWLMNRAYSIQLNSGDMLASREGIDKAMEAANNE